MPILCGHLQTPRLATSATGSVVWRWDGDGFGDVAATGSAEINIRFPGQYHDAEGGLYYNYYRSYDPTTGRYLRSDPMGLIGGMNTYGYAYQSTNGGQGRLAGKYKVLCKKCPLG